VVIYLREKYESVTVVKFLHHSKMSFKYSDLIMFLFQNTTNTLINGLQKAQHDFNNNASVMVKKVSTL